MKFASSFWRASVWREPLLHFVLAGVAIFVVYGAFGRHDDASRRIVVDTAQADRLATLFATQWQRPPTPAELWGLIDQYVDEEVLYREARALHLDDGDTIVRRRLAQKMQFMIEDTAPTPVPTEADLRAYFDAHVADFKTAPYLSFTHVYFSADRRRDAAADARQLRSTIGDVDRAADRGDPFMLRYDYADVSRDDVARLFGEEFADAIFRLPSGAWQGPIHSSFGFHLVRVAGRTNPPPPEFAAVVDKVRAAWLEDARRRTNAETLAKIKSRYEIVLTPLAGANAQ